MYYDSVIYDSFLDDLEAKGKIKGTGSFDFDFVVLEFFESLLIVDIEGQFPYVDTDTDFPFHMVLSLSIALPKSPLSHFNLPVKDTTGPR